MIQVLTCDISLALKELAIKLGYQDGNELQQVCDDLAYGGLTFTQTFYRLPDGTKYRISSRIAAEQISSTINNITHFGSKACQLIYTK